MNTLQNKRQQSCTGLGLVPGMSFSIPHVFEILAFHWLPGSVACITTVIYHCNCMCVTCVCCGSILSFVQIFFLLFSGMVMYDNKMSLKQKKRKFEPRIKLNHNMYVQMGRN